MVGESGHHGLNQPVDLVRDGSARDHGQDEHGAEHQQRRQHSDGEEVAAANRQARSNTRGHERQVEEQRGLTGQQHVEDHHDEHTDDG